MQKTFIWSRPTTWIGLDCQQKNGTSWKWNLNKQNVTLLHKHSLSLWFPIQFILSPWFYLNVWKSKVRLCCFYYTHFYILIPSLHECEEAIKWPHSATCPEKQMFQKFICPTFRPDLLGIVFTEALNLTQRQKSHGERDSHVTCDVTCLQKTL